MTTRLAAPDINCDGCKTAIEAALSALPGVEAVVSGRVVDVVHGPTVDAAVLARLMEEMEYPVAAAGEVG